MIRQLILSSVVLALALCSAFAQTPAPVVIQAVPAANAPVTTQRAPSAEPNIESALQALLSLKAANDEILKKQAATFQKLEEIEKAAEQIKIYSKRG